MAGEFIERIQECWIAAQLDPAWALDVLHRVIELEPDHALALEIAAHCACMVGDRRSGRQWANRADDLGLSETDKDWRAGTYRLGDWGGPH